MEERKQLASQSYLVGSNYKPRAPLYATQCILYSPPLDKCLDESGVALACRQVKERHASEGLGVD